MMTLSKLKRPQSLFDMALEGIRESIVDGTIELGEQLSENQISQQMGISKTPVREALQELRREGLIRIDARKGTSVFKPDAHQLADLFDIRILLETGSAILMFSRSRPQTVRTLEHILSEMESSIAGERYREYMSLDSDFHNAIIDGAMSELIRETYRPLSSKFNALRNRNLKSVRIVRKSFSFHNRLVELARTSEIDKFNAALSQHIKNSKSDYENWLLKT